MQIYQTRIRDILFNNNILKGWLDWGSACNSTEINLMSSDFSASCAWRNHKRKWGPEKVMPIGRTYEGGVKLKFFSIKILIIQSFCTSPFWQSSHRNFCDSLSGLDFTCAHEPAHCEQYHRTLLCSPSSPPALRSSYLQSPLWASGPRAESRKLAFSPALVSYFIARALKLHSLCLYHCKIFHQDSPFCLWITFPQEQTPTSSSFIFQYSSSLMKLSKFPPWHILLIGCYFLPIYLHSCWFLPTLPNIFQNNQLSELRKSVNTWYVA